MQAWIFFLKRHGHSPALPALVMMLLLGSAPLRALAAAPVNDFCQGALAIPGAGPFPYPAPIVDITSATSAGELLATNRCQPFVSRGVWYVFTPSQSGPYTLSTCSPSTTVDDTVMAIFTSVAGCTGPFIHVVCD